MGLNHAFDVFRKGLEIDPQTDRYIAERQQQIREALQKKWPGTVVFFSGSYGRSTKIKPIVDVDLFVVRDETVREIAQIRHDPGAFRQELYTFLQQLLPSQSIRPQRRSVGITFVDVPAEHRFRLDVVPALRRKDGGYFIPDTTGPGWLFTNPEAHKAFTSERDRACQQMAVPLVKMLKAWNRTAQAGLKSFHLETMVLRSLAGKPESFPTGARQVLEKLTKAVQDSCGDPGRSGGRLDEYLTGPQRTIASSAAARAAATLSQAIAADGLKDHAKAVKLARDVFGPAFPTS